TLAPISLFADTTAGVTEPKSLGSIYAPFGRLIPCETIITVDSASIQTPIVGLITENIYHAGKLVIPAGTEVHGTAQTDRQRERIASGGSWTLVWQGGEELRLSAIALDREFSGDQEGWGITDGSAGLRGRVIKSDDMAEIKLFAATFLSGAAASLTEKEQTIFGSVESRSLNNAPFKGAEKVLSVYAQRIYDAIQRDGFLSMRCTSAAWHGAADCCASFESSGSGGAGPRRGRVRWSSAAPSRSWGRPTSSSGSCCPRGRICSRTPTSRSSGSWSTT